jgi:hypothetical protein
MEQDGPKHGVDEWKIGFSAVRKIAKQFQTIG